MRRIFVIPSWYPSDANPGFATYIREQIQDFNRLSRLYKLYLGMRSDRDSLLSMRRPWQVLREFGRNSKTKDQWLNDTDGTTKIISNPAFSLRNLPGIWSAAQRDYALHKKNLGAMIEKYGPIELIHAHLAFPAGVTANALHREFNVPYIVTEHRFDFLRRAKQSDPKLWKTLNRVYHEAAMTVCVGNAQAQFIREEFGVEVDVIPNFTSEKKFTKKNSPAAGAKKFTFVSLCGMDLYKGIDVLIDAIACWAPDPDCVRFVLGGDGKDLVELKRRAERLGISNLIAWVGQVDRTDINEFYEQADAFVLPSRSESFGIVYIEALAKGLPIIATACGGPEDIVTEVNGLLVSVDDVQGLASALSRMLNSADRFDSDRIRQDFEERFAAPIVVQQVQRLYDNVFGQKPCSKA